MGKLSIKDITLRVCFGILLFFVFSILLRFLTRQILVDMFHMQNGFTRAVFYGNEDAGKLFTDEGNVNKDKGIEINWVEIYPFEQEDLEAYPVVNVHKETWADRWKQSIMDLESRIEVYTGELLAGYMQSVEWMNRIEEAVGWDIASYAEYNGVIELDDGHLTECYQPQDVSEDIMSVKKLYDFCADNGMDFLYVQAPYKISKYQDEGISVALDYTNQNADELLKGVKKEKIPFLDLREEIEKEGLDHHSLFYYTDHHWKIESGLWAAGVVAKELNNEYDMGIDLDVLEPERFTFQTYDDWFLGSHGRQVTLSRTEPDDFTEVYPNYETSFVFQMPTMDMHKEGDDSYLSYLYGGGPVIRIQNRQVQGKKLLFIKDSFAISVIPFLALGVEEVDVLDVREFTGSTKAFIEVSQPDMVIVLYNPSSIKEIDWPSHMSAFDFR